MTRRSRTSRARAGLLIVSRYVKCGAAGAESCSQRRLTRSHSAGWRPCESTCTWGEGVRLLSACLLAGLMLQQMLGDSLLVTAERTGSRES
jgi:hypothetical protein